jgi:predicted RecA/RadA family phage recombinase
MTQARFIQGSVETMDYTPGSAVTAGDVVAFGNGVAIAHSDIEADRLGALAIGGGTYDFAKSGSSGPVFAVGDGVFWNDSSEVAETSGGLYIGKCVQAAGASDTTVRVHHITPDQKPS